MKNYWWNSDDIAKDLFGVVQKISSNQEHRTILNKRHLRLVGTSDYKTLSAVENFLGDDEKLRLNVIQSMVETVHSKMSKNNPKLSFLTSGGDWSIKRKAKKLNKFCEGQFYMTKLYDVAPDILMDALTFGTGFLKIFEEDCKIKIERIFPNNIIIDDQEAVYGKPRTMYQVHYIHREVLASLYPKYKDTIEFLKIEQDDFLFNENNTDMVKVIEAWHLPSKDHKGLHCISVENQVLFQEEWKKDYFPFVCLRWNKRALGFFGQGLPEQLTSIQMEINKTLITIQKIIHLGCVPKIFLADNSKIIKEHLNNKIGSVITFNGTAPRMEQLMSVPPELFRHLDWLVNKAYEIVGVSMLSAQSKKPAGLDSGVAIREYNDIESERFLAFGKRYENMFMECGRIFIDMAKDINEKLKKDKKKQAEYEVKFPKGKSIENIKWSDIDLNDDQYIMQMFPTSSLPSHPSGRLEKVQELIQSGIIPAEYALDLLDFPDLESYSERANADIKDIERLIERFIDMEEEESEEESIFVPPEEFQNLNLGIDMMQKAYLYWKNQGAPDDRLELFRVWIEQAKDKVGQIETAVQNQMMEEQAMAQPVQAPVNDLLPFEV